MPLQRVSKSNMMQGNRDAGSVRRRSTISYEAMSVPMRKQIISILTYIISLIVVFDTSSNLACLHIKICFILIRAVINYRLIFNYILHAVIMILILNFIWYYFNFSYDCNECVWRLINKLYILLIFRCSKSWQAESE